MKKTLAILIALAMVVTAASAQVAVKGSLKVGGLFAIGDDFFEDPIFMMNQDNVANEKFNEQDMDGYQQANVEFKYTNGPAGMKINMRAKGIEADVTTFATNVAYVWLDMFGADLKLLYGLTEDNTFRVGTYNQPDIDANSSYNATFIYKTPVEGLTVAISAAMPVPGAAAKISSPTTTTYTPTASGAAVVEVTKTTVANAVTVKQFLADLCYGVKYVNPMFAVTAGFAGDKKKGGFQDDSANGYLGLNLTAVKKLTFMTYASMFDINKEDSSYIQTETTAGYAVTDIIGVSLTAGTLGLTKLESDADVKSMEIYFLPAVKYSVSPAVLLTLEGYYSLNQGKTRDRTDMYLEPRVGYTVSDNAKIACYYNYYTKDLNNKTVGKASMNVIGVDFNYSF